MRTGTANNLLWYKDAIIYELPVKSFSDGNADGVGDFPGLCEKLDHLHGLGAACLWLLPFFPSPLNVRRYGDDLIPCVASLSRTVQPAELDLSAFAGLMPVEMLGVAECPTIGSKPCVLTLGPYGFYWFELQRSGN